MTRIKFIRRNLIRAEDIAIVKSIRYDSSVLDLGCGDGELLSLLIREKRVRGEGVELDKSHIHKCVSRGISVSQQNLDDGLSDYPDGSFDYVILSHTLQELRNPDIVLREALRVGKRVIVVFPNFAYYRARLHIFFTGRVPVTPSLPYQWHDTPNLHFLSIADFTDYCDRKNLKIEKTFFVRKNRFISIAPNLFGQIGVFVISPDTETKPKSEDQIPWHIF